MMPHNLNSSRKTHKFTQSTNKRDDEIHKKIGTFKSLMTKTKVDLHNSARVSKKSKNKGEDILRNSSRSTTVKEKSNGWATIIIIIE